MRGIGTSQGIAIRSAVNAPGEASPGFLFAKIMEKLSSLPKLNREQRKQIRKQWRSQQHRTHTEEIPLSGHGESLIKFLVERGVWNPATVSARYHASYLFYNNVRLFAGRTAIDMGTGTGILGIVMALGGAKRVIMSDISVQAVHNTEKNIKLYDLQKETAPGLLRSTSQRQK